VLVVSAADRGGTLSRVSAVRLLISRTSIELTDKYSTLRGPPPRLFFFHTTPDINMVLAPPVD
jgi:hypothetical protein